MYGEYEDMCRVIEKMHPQPTPCELAAANDRLMQKVSALCKERDEAHRQIDQLVIRLNDETERVARLEAESRAKEQYIAETISKVIIERDELRRSLNKEIVATGDAMLEISSLKKEIDKLRAENKRLISLARGAE